jgi:glycosyltransferase involved in cell wall biosynthesis
MRILLISVAPLRKELGASKVLIELAEELERLDWHCQLSSIPELLGRNATEGDFQGAEALRSYLHKHASDYDVVDYGLGYLPFPRTEFAANTLFVERSVLLIHHFDDIKLPTYRTWKARAHALVYGRRTSARHREIVDRVDRSLAGADLVNVSNDDDKAILIRAGVPKDKIVVIPYGLSLERLSIFEQRPTLRAEAPTVAFVGTFDSRKGATDFPTIVSRIVDNIPEARFLLLGTYKSESDVLARFPRGIRSKIRVVPHYPADSLPELLSPCAIGVFPSYIEGFGFGVLEMLAAGLPVIAYAAPGPPMMLPDRYLVPIGDAAALSDKVIAMLRNESTLAAASAWAKERTRDFLWPAIARTTSDAYLEAWRLKQTNSAK